MKKEIENLYNKFKELHNYKCEFKYNPDNYSDHFVEFDEVDKLTFPDKGIYFLLIGDFVTYVGMSDFSIKQRIFPTAKNTYFQKHSDTKIFNSFKFINMNELSKKEILSFERKYINMFNPPENKLLNDSTYVSLMPKDYLKISNKGKVKFWNYFNLKQKQKDEKFAEMLVNSNI